MTKSTFKLQKSHSNLQNVVLQLTRSYLNFTQYKTKLSYPQFRNNANYLKYNKRLKKEKKRKGFPGKVDPPLLPVISSKLFKFMYMIKMLYMFSFKTQQHKKKYLKNNKTTY